MASTELAAVPPASPARVHAPLSFLWRAATVGLGAALLTAIGGLLARSIGLPVPSIASRLDPAAALAARAGGGVLLALVIGPLSRRLAVPALQRAAVVFLLLLVVNNLVNVIEGMFFTDYFDAPATILLSVTVNAAGLSLLLAWLFPPPAQDHSLRQALGGLLARRTAGSWLWRTVLAAVLYVPAYFVFGAIAFQFVHQYYEDPSLGMALRVPGLETILPLEVLRGFLYVFAVFPLLALLPGRRWVVGLSIGAVMAVLNGWEPLLTNTFWPIELRVTHGLEITADSVAHGLLIAWLLGARAVRSPGPGTSTNS